MPKYIFEEPNAIILNSRSGIASLSNCADIGYSFSDSNSYVVLEIDDQAFTYKDLNDLKDLITALQTQLTQV